MIKLKSVAFIYLLPAFLAFLVSFGCHRSSKQRMQICNHLYALCTSAKCIPHPADPARAICFCDVLQGKSVSTVACSNLKPSTDRQGITTVYSTFSLEQFSAGMQGMKCPSGTPWSWCLNKRCTVDPSNPDKAICICDVMRTGEWMTAGGNCDPATCSTGYWSGATVEEGKENALFLAKKLGLSQSPVKWCSANGDQ